MKPVLTDAQKALIERTLRAIEAEPQTFDMEDWAQSDPTCGTVCCFGGHLAVQARNASLRDVDALWCEISGDGIGDIAAAALGVYNTDDLPLFYVEDWPDTFADAFRAAVASERPAILRARVEHWMETGE